MAAHNGMYHQMRLPDRLHWPMIYLAREQTDVLSKPKLRGVREYIDNLELREDDCLPAWVPHAWFASLACAWAGPREAGIGAPWGGRRPRRAGGRRPGPVRKS